MKIILPIKLVFLFILLIIQPKYLFADYSWDFYRFQCIPEIGKIYIEKLSIYQPDDFGYLNRFDENKEIFDKLENEHEIYIAMSRLEEREHFCKIGDEEFKVIFAFNSNKQGQVVGKISILNEDGQFYIKRLEFFAYYGYQPVVKKIEITYYPNKNEYMDSNFYAKFFVHGSMKNYPDAGSINLPFSFSYPLNIGKTVTQKTINNEEKRLNSATE